MMLLRVISALFFLVVASPAFAQCGPTTPGGTLCGNRTGSQGLTGPLTNPVLGIPGTSTGQIGFAGATSGTATIVPQSAAGTPTLTLPNTSGTLPSTAASPLVLDATTGQLSCPTCYTGSGGALTATAPLFLTSGVLSLQGATGTIATGSGGTGSAFSATPTLGVAGTTLGTLTLSGNTSGTATFTPQAVAGTSTVLTLPNTSGTLADGASLPLVLDATTGNLTCPTCATTLNGAALTAANDTNVTLTLGGTPATSLLNAASITVGWTGTLAAGRLNSNVVQGFSSSDISTSIAAQVATLAVNAFTGDVTKSQGSLATTVNKFSGNALPVTAGADSQILIGSGASNFIFSTIPNCPSGIIQYTAATHVFNCGPAGAGTVTNVATAGLATGGPITTTGTVTVPAAVKTDQTTGSSTSVAVVPGVQQYHASAAKAWVQLTGSSGAILASYNVSGVVRNSTGDYTISFSTAFTSANYACAPMIYGATPGFVRTASQLAGSIEIQIVNAANTGQFDPSQASLVCFGTE